MSLGPTYIKADDGKWYEEATLRGDDWFICFDEDDPPELVIKDSSSLTPKDIFKLTGLNARVTGKGQWCGRVFTENYDVFDAQAYWLKIKKPVPAASITEHERVISGSIHNILGEFTAYDFNGGTE